jgi:phosphatidylserine/phosphatidylglycerophosphate/cardiolipin synthase-like enzyme
MQGSATVAPVDGAATLLPLRRTQILSPSFRVPDSDVALFMDYTGFKYADEARTNGVRAFESGITPKILKMIEEAETHIILSVFLFDCIYAETESPRDVVREVTDALIRKHREKPGIRIAVILDSTNKAYGRRVSEAERRLLAEGMDVFYSDLLSGLHRATLFGVRESLGHVNRVIDTVTFNGWGALWCGLFSYAKLPVKLDGEHVSVEGAYNAFLLKANHRKLLVTDVHGQDFEALVSSANPHNASAFNINSAVSVRGNFARYVFNVLQEDMRLCAKLGGRYAHWHDGADRAYRARYFKDFFPCLAPSAEPGAECPVGVTFVTEREIARAVLEMLERVEEGDEIRIQMFYLSYQPVLDAILQAAVRSRQPVRLLLDANKDSFNRKKDGTPNRQVARYLLKEAAARGADLRVRWYATHGEQNHAKIMSITNPQRGKYLLTTGSCNWTGRNMDGINMEANVVVEGSPRIVGQFDQLFDTFWTNGGGIEYSLDYEAFAEDTAANRKWRMGEKPFYYSTF